MLSIADLGERGKYLGKLWSEVREEFWGDIRVETRRALKKLLESRREVLSPILGDFAISSGTVSNITKDLSELVFRFHNRAIYDEYKYIILDGIYLNIKSPIYKVYIKFVGVYWFVMV